MRPPSDRSVLDLPEELDLAFYGAAFPDLAHMTGDELAQHYETFGRAEGRRGNGIAERGDFVALIPETDRVLEIGPFCAPMLRGDNVRYFDVLDREGLERRAAQVGYPHRGAPFIHFVSPTGDLSAVDEAFDAVVSSHCIEHQPDLIGHLQKVSRLLEPGGRYFALIPDKRYCFDAFLPETNVAEVLDAHHERRTVHTLRSVVEHRALTTHNDCGEHWAGRHGDLKPDDVARRVAAARVEHERAAGSYIDVHAWQFTPAGAADLMTLLGRLGSIDLAVERLYPTRRDRNEFWLVLRKAA